MHTATCFDSKESSLGYSMNYNIDTSSESAHFGIPKVYMENIQVKVLQNYCPDVLNSLNTSRYLTHLDNKFVTIVLYFSM